MYLCIYVCMYKSGQDVHAIHKRAVIRWVTIFFVVVQYFRIFPNQEWFETLHNYVSQAMGQVAAERSSDTKGAWDAAGKEKIILFNFLFFQGPTALFPPRQQGFFKKKNKKHATLGLAAKGPLRFSNWLVSQAFFYLPLPLPFLRQSCRLFVRREGKLRVPPEQILEDTLLFKIDSNNIVVVNTLV